MKKLNGWQRIGVILSILWMLGAAIQTRNEQIEHARKMLDLNSTLCASMTHLECLSISNSKYTADLAVDAFKLMEILIYALAPMLFGWLFAWLAIVVYRWVRVGFQGIK